MRVWVQFGCVDSGESPRASGEMTSRKRRVRGQGHPRVSEARVTPPFHTANSGVTSRRSFNKVNMLEVVHTKFKNNILVVEMYKKQNHGLAINRCRDI